MLEKHYTIKETASLLRISLEKTRKMVMHEPGVLRIAPEGNRGKPARQLLYRIPESVLERILRRNANPPAPLAAAGKSER
jgi:hypothetical protein